MRNNDFKHAARIGHEHAVSSPFRLFCVHHFFIFLGTILLASGCSFTPTTVVETPTTARAPEIEPADQKSGAIYTQRKFRGLFEDRKPRGVGDIITIAIEENTAANKTTTSSGSKDGDVSTSVGSLFGEALPKATITSDVVTTYADSSTANTSNVFNGSITTTVVEVLPNGYFVVSGEKQIAFDKGTEFVRFSGVVNPDTVTLGNNVSSTQVADARIEYRTTSKIDAAEVANAVARFFFSISAF